MMTHQKPRNLTFKPGPVRPGVRAAPLPPPGVLGRLARVRKVAMAWTATVFTVLWPVYAAVELYEHLRHPNVVMNGITLLVLIFTFVYGLVLKALYTPRTVYTQEGPPPQVVRHVHEQRGRWR